MGEEFQGGVCGGTWWNPPHNLFSSGLSSPCSVAQLGGGGFDVGSFGWPNELVVKGSNNKSSNNNSVFDNLIFSDQIDSSLDILGFGLSPTSSTTDWNNHQNLFCNNGSNEANFESMLQDNLNSSARICSYEMGLNSPNIMNSTNFSNNTQDASPPLALTASSNSSGDSSTITCDGSLATSFPMNSSASYLIQSLFDDSDESHHHQVPQPQSMPNHHQFINSSNNNYASLDSSNEMISPNSWVKTSPNNNTPTLASPQIPLLQSNKLEEGIMNASLINDQGQVFSGQYSPTTLSSIRASLLNSLQSRARAGPSFNHNSHSSAILANKVNSEEHRRESKNNTGNNDQPPVKRPRIETPSPLPTFKVRKEKLGDRITALQQLVSPFGKTDTASVLHEAIEYVKFLHDQVNVLSTPYLKNGTAMQQKENDKSKDNDESNQDLRSRGLCLVPISSTYPVAQETPVDFWTPTFGGTTTFM